MPLPALRSASPQVPVEWLTVGPVGVEWESAFLSGIDSAFDSGVEAFVLTPEDLRPAELIVLAYMAEIHGEAGHIAAVVALQERLHSSPATRCAAVALGLREPDGVTKADVHSVLCSDGIDTRRYPEAIGALTDFVRAVRSWVVLCGKAKVVSGPIPLRVSNEYESERLIRDNASTSTSSVWMGGL